jgi:hypothetical protein
MDKTRIGNLIIDGPELGESRKGLRSAESLSGVALICGPRRDRPSPSNAATTLRLNAIQHGMSTPPNNQAVLMQ